MNVIAIYVRVSTDEQAQHGTSIDHQKERLIAFCKSQGWDEYKLYIDDGYTGTNTNRPALKRLLRHIDEGQVNTVLVYKLDRLGRKQIDVLNLLETFENVGVAFKSATEPFDTSTPLGKAMIGILAVFAQLERDMIVERTSSGRRQRTSKGLWYGGRVPFGYKWNEKAQQLEIVPEQARIVQEIFKRFLQGQSRLSIAEWAASRTTARVIDHSVIRDMIDRVVYMGKLMNGDSMVDGQHEAIIDPETWFQAQREKTRRKEGLTGRGEFLLSGLLRCGVCDSGIVHVKRKTKRNGKEYLYELYACKNQHVRKKERTDDYCYLGYRKRSEIEEEVINEIKSIALNPKKLKTLSEKNNKSDDDGVKESLESQLHKINEGLENLYDAIQTGVVKAAAVSNRIRKLEEEQETIINQLEELKDEEIDQVDPTEIYLLAKQVGEAWDYLEPDEQRMMVRKVINEIILLPGKKLEIHWNVI